MVSIISTMTNSNADTPKLQTQLAQAYHQLPPLTQKIVQLFSVIYEPINRTSFMNCLNQTGALDENNKQFVNKTLSRHIDGLLEAGLLVQESGQGPQCHPLLTEIATRDLVQTGRFEILATAVEEKLPILGWQHPRSRAQKTGGCFPSWVRRCILISLKAGGTGLNLTAADYVIHMDPWWNPAVEDQASDRAHRIGQQRPVTIYRLVAKDTIEDKIVDLHHHKRDLADSLLEGADMSGKISTEALLQLING